MKKRILAVTGIRSEYDILRPVIAALKEDKRFEVGTVVSGAHLTEWHGHTIDQIRKDGFHIVDTIHSLLLDNTGLQRAKGSGLLISGLAETVQRYRPDLLMVVGDREESIAAAVVGNYMNTLVAHIGGGDSVYGNSDDPIRFAVSKLAHLHFVTSEDSATNVRKCGEEKFRIFNVGNPSLDNIRTTPKMFREKLNRALGLEIKSKSYFVLLHHPLSSEHRDAGRQMETLLAAARKFCIENSYVCVGIYPNTDPGSLDILRVIDSYKEDPFIHFFKTLPREIFVNLLRHASALIGNSSMGLLEAPFYGLPVVNVGNRQKGRLNAGNVEFIDFKPAAIDRSLKKACEDRKYREKVKTLKNPFGDGHSSAKIKQILLSLDLSDSRWYLKRSTR